MSCAALCDILYFTEIDTGYFLHSSVNLLNPDFLKNSFKIRVKPTFFSIMKYLNT